MQKEEQADASQPDGAYAWVRLVAALLIGTIGGVGMWSYAVVLPAMQAEFGVSRGWASVPYTAIMLGFGVGGIVMGRVSDRFGIFVPIVVGAVMLGLGYSLAGFAQSLLQFTLIMGLLIGMLGAATVFGPLLADVSRWFVARRGLAVGICASGNYVAGTVWPPVVQHLVEQYGWRSTHIGIGLVCAATMLPLAMVMRRRAPTAAASAAASATPRGPGSGLPGASSVAAAGVQGGAAARAPVASGTMMMLLVVAGFGCCMAMAMPQVHLVAYCGDLGYGPARGAEMLSLMMGMGVISRLASGWICDHIGGLRTLLAGSVLQGLALMLYLPFDGLTSLYVISAMFGLFQGGIVPSYAIIVREHFPAQEAGVRIGIVLFATLIGMALGGWSSGRIFDLTGSYGAAFAHGVFWNLVNCSIVLWLIWRTRGPDRGGARAGAPMPVLR